MQYGMRRGSKTVTICMYLLVVLFSITEMAWAARRGRICIGTSGHGLGSQTDSGDHS